MEVHLKALTPIWTGDINRECKGIKETGIIGSLRWWYEALVRGLGGYACDPTSDEKCIYKGDINKICPACQLFGCTGWSRKFRLAAHDTQNQPMKGPIQGNMEFKLVLFRTKPLKDKELWLLEKTFWLISKYGSIGGKTILKPQRNERFGKDFGILELAEQLEWAPQVSRPEVEKFLESFLSRKVSNKKMPNLSFFFFKSGAFLWRSQMNQLMGKVASLKGKPGESKKIFSFQTGGGRIWGYAGNGQELEKVLEVLEGEMNITGVKRGSEVINEL